MVDLADSGIDQIPKEHTYCFTNLVKARRFAEAKYKEGVEWSERDACYHLMISLNRVDLPKMSSKKKVLAVAGFGWCRYSTELQRWNTSFDSDGRPKGFEDTPCYGAPGNAPYAGGEAPSSLDWRQTPTLSEWRDSQGGE